MTVFRTPLSYSEIPEQLAAQDTKDLNFFAQFVALGFIVGALLITCGVMLAMQLDHHQKMQLLRAENERLIILDSKCLEVK